MVHEFSTYPLHRAIADTDEFNKWHGLCQCGIYITAATYNELQETMKERHDQISGGLQTETTV